MPRCQRVKQMQRNKLRWYAFRQRNGATTGAPGRTWQFVEAPSALIAKTRCDKKRFEIYVGMVSEDAPMSSVGELVYYNNTKLA
jgi:hypothetical protein